MLSKRQPLWEAKINPTSDCNGWDIKIDPTWTDEAGVAHVGNVENTNNLSGSWQPDQTQAHWSAEVAWYEQQGDQKVEVDRVSYQGDMSKPTGCEVPEQTPAPTATETQAPVPPSPTATTTATEVPPSPTATETQVSTSTPTATSTEVVSAPPTTLPTQEVTQSPTATSTATVQPTPTLTSIPTEPPSAPVTPVVESDVQLPNAPALNTPVPSESAAPTPTANATEQAFSSLNNGKGGLLPTTGGEQNYRPRVVEGVTSLAVGGVLVGLAWIIRRRNEGFARQARTKRNQSHK